MRTRTLELTSIFKINLGLEKWANAFADTKNLKTEIFNSLIRATKTSNNKAIKNSWATIVKLAESGCFKSQPYTIIEVFHKIYKHNLYFSNILFPTKLHLKNVYYLYSACSNPTNVVLLIVLSMITGKGAL